MSTKSRLGIDIAAVDKTGAAFASVERSMKGLNSSFNQFKGALVAIGVGNAFQNLVQGIVRVNAQTEQGKLAADRLNGAFESFAIKVGEAGLLKGMTDLSVALNTSNREGNRLAEIMGTIAGKSLSALASAIPGVTAEMNDLAASFGAAADQGSRIANIYRAVDEFFRKYGPMSQNAQDGFFGMFPSSGKTSLPEGTLDRLLTRQRSGFQATNSDLQKMLTSVDEFGTKSKSLKPSTPGIKTLIPPNTIEDIYGAGSAIKALQESFENSIQPAGAFSDALVSIGSTISNSLTTGLDGLIRGTMSVKDAFTSMAEGILSTMADLAAQLAINAGFKLLLGALGGGGGAGFNIGGMIFGGLFANGGTLGAGQWGIAGEAGPEIVHGPARITPMSKVGGSMTVNITNNVGADIITRQGTDGSLNIDIVKKQVRAELTRDLARGGNDISSALERGYGLRRSGR